ncbi:MAG TPA: serine hydrolase domain-containing protein [Thermoanaerobaculia bacterium]|nr:serine hydrolase domain-containing protein [Thermoanaerobaculia bacterium]
MIDEEPGSAWRSGTRVLSVIALSLCVAPALSADAIDDLVRSHMRQSRLPGVALAVMHNGVVSTMRTYGAANMELDAPVTADSVFELGSLTKQFTAFAVMMLVEEGKLDLDGSIARYLPAVPESWRGITVRHLLTHSAGIEEYLSVPALADEAHAATHDEMTQMFFRRLRLEFEAGQTWAYSNSGYLLLGNIIERVTGKSYWDFLHQRIFAPLGMNATRSSEPGAIIPRRAAGYGWRDGAFENRGALSGNAYSAGSIASTIRDMARWEAALHSGKLLTRRSYEAMWTALEVRRAGPPPFSYGFGWVVDKHGGSPVVLHSGGTPGFSSAIHRYLGPAVSVIVLANHGDRIIDPVAVDVAGIAFPALARSRGKRDPDPELTKRLRDALAGLLAGQPDPRLFTPAMQLFLTTAIGKGLWEWIGSHGELGPFAYAGQEDSRLRFRATLGEAETWFSVTVAEDGRIAQIWWW